MYTPKERRAAYRHQQSIKLAQKALPYLFLVYFALCLVHTGTMDWNSGIR